AAIIKVHSSEALDYVVDEGVQIYVGMGYSAEAPMERSFRNARIKRVFEGTNEINRLLSFDMMVRKGMKGELPLLPAAQNIAKEMMEIPDFNAEKPEGVLALELERIQKFKKAILLVAGAALQKYMQKIAHQQELIMYIADMLTETYVAESTILRVQKLYNIQKDAKYIEEKIKIAQL